jgi:hypothetical protein
MKKLMTAALALSALFAASGKVHAEMNYPWCVMGETRGFECVFSTREQMYAGRKKSGFWWPVHTKPCLQSGSPDRFSSG